MTGSFLYSSKEKLTFGIGAETQEYTKTIAHMYLLPVKRVVRMGWIILSKNWINFKLNLILLRKN